MNHALNNRHVLLPESKIRDTRDVVIAVTHPRAKGNITFLNEILA